jgi:hypothetical protein
VQESLKHLGFDPGAIDGVMATMTDERTRDALNLVTDQLERLRAGSKQPTTRGQSIRNGQAQNGAFGRLEFATTA